MRSLKALLGAVGLAAFLAGSSTAYGDSWFDSVRLVELKGGVLVHDVTADNDASGSIDINPEIVFQGDDFFPFENKILQFIFNPRGIVGATINTEGDTHTAYIALGWEHQFKSNFFVGASFGGAGHTGNLDQETAPCPSGFTCSLPGNRFNVDSGEPRLGSRFLFRESIEVGYRTDGGHSISAYFAHISNGGFDDDNDGMDFAGVRYGIAF